MKEKKPKVALRHGFAYLGLEKASAKKERKELRTQKKAEAASQPNEKRKAIVKKRVVGISVASVVAIAIVFVFTYPIIVQKNIDKKMSTLPVMPHAATKLETELPKDDEGKVIYYTPAEEKEVKESCNFLEERLVKDATALGLGISKIDKIKGIYSHKTTSNEMPGDTLIHFVVESEGQDYIIEYTALNEDYKENSFKIFTFKNDADTISSLMYDLQKCYLSGTSLPQDEEILYMLSSKECEAKVIGNPYFYMADAVNHEYKIPVYTEKNAIMFSIKEGDVLDNSLEANEEAVYLLFWDYLQEKNNLFSFEKIESIENSDKIEKIFNNSVIKEISDENLEDFSNQDEK